MMGFENLCATIARAKGSNLDAEEYTWWTNIYQPNSHYGSKRTTTLTSSLFNLYPDYSTSWFARMSNFLKLKTLSLIAADEIASLAVQTALKNSFQPIAVCVMDASGATIVTKRMDGCPSMAYPKISEAKANTCVAMKCSSRAYGAKYLQKDSTPDVFVRVLNQISTIDGNVAAFPGGVLIRDATSKQIVGAVGVSGAAGAEDEYIALTAIKLSSLSDSVITEPEKHDRHTVQE